MTHSVPPMPQIDTPPPAIVRGGTENDASLDTAMRETEFVTAVEIDHEAKARYEEERRLAEGATVASPPLRTSEERAAMTDEGLAAHAQGDVPGDDTDATQTATAERMDLDALQDEVARPPAKAAPDVPFKSLSAAKAAETKSVEKPAPAKSEKTSAPKVPISTAPASLPPPKSAAIPASGPTPACPQCEAPMAWVEEHLRFYCKSCRMYF